jgi:hypothetical protein
LYQLHASCVFPSLIFLFSFFFLSHAHFLLFFLLLLFLVVVCHLSARVR